MDTMNPYDLIESELRMRGISLKTWCEERGLCALMITRDLVDPSEAADWIRAELAETLGVAVKQLKQLLACSDAVRRVA